MSPFEALYGCFHNTLISWSDTVNKVVIGLGMLDGMEQEMKVIKSTLKETQYRKKSYAY